MATAHRSRNPFADPGLPTLADLIARIAANPVLSARSRQNWIWALRTAARAAGKDSIAVPAHPEYLRKLMDQAAPESIGISRAGWNNARSLMGKALQWAGLASMPGHYQAPFAPPWAALWDKLPPGKNALRMQLSRLFHYCSAQGTSPLAISDEVLSAFHQALVSESIVEQPHEVYRGAAKSWNNAVERVAGWPPRRLTVPSRQKLFTLPWSAFPPSLAQDVEAYCRRAAGLDLGDDHFIRPQRPATIKTRRWQLRLLATAVAKSGVALEGLRDLLQPETAAAGLTYLLERNGGTSSPQISHLSTFLPTLAGRLEMPDDAIAQLRKIAAKLKLTQNGMTVKNREALRAFDDEAAVKALLTLPARLLNEIIKSGRKGYREAKTIQTALAIALLLNAPVRIKNLASIELERHLVEVGGRRDRRVHLRFPAAEVKNANDLEFPLVPEAVDLLDLYVAVWRPILCPTTSPFLFPGERSDQHKGKAALSSQIKDLVYTYTRLDMPAHRFRHAAGKMYLDRHPGEYEVVRQLLGHKDIKTTIAFYAGAETASAARHYAQTILGIRGADAYPEGR